MDSEKVAAIYRQMIKMRTNTIFALLMLAVSAALAIADEVDDLILDLNDEDEKVRRSAAEDLGKIGDPRAVNPLNEALTDDDNLIRIAAALSLDESVRKAIGG